MFPGLLCSGGAPCFWPAFAPEEHNVYSLMIYSVRTPIGVLCGLRKRTCRSYGAKQFKRLRL